MVGVREKVANKPQGRENGVHKKNTRTLNKELECMSRGYIHVCERQRHAETGPCNL